MVRNVLSRGRIAGRALFFSCLALFAVSVHAQPPEALQNKNDIVGPEKLSASFAEVAKRVEPAVVSIDTKGRITEVTFRGDQGEPSKDIEDFIRRNIPPRPAYAVGSGFIVDPEGFVLTNYHVVQNAEKIKVTLQNGDEFEARVLGADEETDVAVLKINAGRSLPFINFGNSDETRIGEWVLAIGSPFGLARTVTAGIISQTNRETPDGNAFQKFLQTDAAINRGNSGGPLVDMNGRVIGINSQIATSTGDYNGIGFALPSNQAENVYKQIKSYGKVKRGYLGVYLDSVGKEFAKVYGLGEARGAIITSILDDRGAAAKAGLKDNDIILTVDGKAIQNAQDLIGKIASTPPGQAVKVGYLRESGEKLVAATVTVNLDERPGNEIQTNEPDEPRTLPISDNATKLPFGLTLEALTADDAKDRNLEGRNGLLVVRIDPMSFVMEETSATGAPVLQRGDLIERINRKPVGDIENFTRTVRAMKVGAPVVLHVSIFNRETGKIVPRVVQFTVK